MNPPDVDTAIHLAVSGAGAEVGDRVETINDRGRGEMTARERQQAFSRSGRVTLCRARGMATPSTRLLSLHFAQLSRVDVVDEPSDRDGLRNEGAVLDAAHIIAHALLEIGEREEVDVGGIFTGLRR